jgi:hypothetical protein
VLGLATAMALVLTAVAFAQEAQQQAPQQPEQQAQQDEPVLGPTGSVPAAEPAPAGTEEPAPIAVEGQIVEQEPDTFAASDLLVEWVSSMDGEALGKVDDLLISADDKVAGVVVDVGGFLGFGAKPIAIQIDRLIMSDGPDGERQLILDTTRDELEQAPEFVSLKAQREAAEYDEARRVQEQALDQLNSPQPAGSGGTVVPPTQ